MYQLSLFYELRILGIWGNTDLHIFLSLVCLSNIYTVIIPSEHIGEKVSGWSWNSSRIHYVPLRANTIRKRTESSSSPFSLDFYSPETGLLQNIWSKQFMIA